jgi:hypothetical protein
MRYHAAEIVAANWRLRRRLPRLARLADELFGEPSSERQKGDDDGMEYGDPRDERDERW